MNGQMDMYSALSEIDKVRKYLLVLGWSENHGLCEVYTGYKKPEDIPGEKLGAVAKKLFSEVKYFNLLGREAYDKNKSILSKLDMYSKAIDDMYELVASEGSEDSFTTWIDFKTQFNDTFLKRLG